VGGLRRRCATAALSLWLLAACGDVEPLPPPPEPWGTTTRLLARRVLESPFGFGSFRRGDVSHHGLWVPGGESFAREVAIPAGAVLAVQTAAGNAASTGRARYAVDLHPGTGEWQVLLPEASAGALEAHRIELSAWAGQKVWIRLRAEGVAADDVVFFGEPSVFVPSASPRRVALIFIDTLRPDHLGVYGYERDTSPRLDELAETAAVFEVARAPAPWTLPSARSALSGRQPEAWAQAPHLGEQLADEGFATLATTSNAFLGAAFDMDRGWTEYQMHSKAIAEDVVDRALTQLERHRDRDVLLLVHFMDPHLPYREPESYQGRFDRSAPARRGETLDRKDLLALDPSDPGFESDRQHIVDRYDQTIRYLDDELARLLDAIGPEATVVLFSDHGEEFWEHGGAEHGHTLFEEVLRVPLIVRDPAIPAGRHRASASLLDITPTVLELVGVAGQESDGTSLVPVARRRPSAKEALDARPEAYGRMLYGGERWAVRRGDRKWSTWAGRQLLVDLAGDPQERADLSTRPDAELPGYVELLSETLGREVHGVWRILLGLPPSAEETRVRISHPDGIAEAWPHPDPLGRRSGSTLQQHGGVIELIQPAGATAPATLTLLPVASAASPRGLRIEIQSGGKRLEGRVERDPPPFGGGASPPLLRIGDGTHGALALSALSPRLDGQPGPVLEEGVRDALKELGYLE